MALVVVAISVAAYGATAPFTTVPMGRIDSFIPVLAGIIFVTDLITAALLFGQFSATGARAILVLASGYLFSSLLIIPYALTFPGTFAPLSALGAGPQSAAWLNVSVRFGLAAAIVGYALLKSDRPTKGSIEASPGSAIFVSVAIVITVVCTLTVVVTAGHDLLPRVLDGNGILPLGYRANEMIALTHLLGLAILWSRRKSILDVWLMVAVCGLIAETVIVVFFTLERFTIGFYATRIIPLTVAKFVLIVLLSETIVLQTRLSVANRNLQRERENRLTSAEAVVASLAHEVRQPLASMSSRASAGRRFLDRDPPDVATAQRLFEQITDAASRANDVFESFLALFRGGRQDHQAVDVNALVLEAVQLLRKELDDHNVIAHTALESDIPMIQGNRGQLREVVLNLLQNSIEAMAASAGRRIISIATGRHGPGSISISLQDTGPGIDPDKLASIFDPFVTTKAKGTGLGLAICKMIIEQHGGKLAVASGIDAGARFEVTLPNAAAVPFVPETAAAQRRAGG